MTISSIISLVLKGEDQASGAFDAVSGKVGGLGSLLGGAAIAAPAAIAVGALVGVGAASLFMAQDFDASMNLFQARTGASEEAMVEFRDTALDVFTQNYGESLDDVASTMGVVNQQLGLSGEELGEVSTQALILRDVFEKDVSETVRATGSAVRNFGTDSTHVMDLMTAAIQRTGDPAGDLLDTVNEYSSDFAEAGFSADEMTNILIAGLEAGAFNFDTVGDSVREFTTRIVDGSDTTRDALTAIGIDADGLYASFTDGSMETGDAMELVIDQLKAMEDPIARDAAGVAFFGSKWEDLGADVILGLGGAEDALGDVEGATLAAGETVSQGLGPAFETAKRQVMTALLPLGDFLGGLLASWTPHLETAAAWLAEKIPEATAVLADFWATTLEPAIGNLIDRFQADVLPVLQNVADWILNQGVPGFLAFAEPIVDQLIPGLQQLSEWGTQIYGVVLQGLGLAAQFVVDHWNVLAPIFAVVGVVILALTSPVSLLIGAVVLLATAWANNWGDIQGKTQAAWSFIQPFLQAAWDWLSLNVPAALETLRSFWVDTAWPAIQSAIQTVWPIIEGIFTTLVGWVTGTLIPTLQSWQDKWVGEVWPAIETALDNAWTVIEAIWTELGRWVNDNLVPWIEYFQEVWADTVWPAIESAVETAWDLIKPIWEAIKAWADETLPVAIEGLQTVWEGVMSALTTAVQPVKDLWDRFVGAVQSFWNWITSHTFNFKISLPDLPAWALPDSPLPIHTAWKSFAEEMARMEIAPRLVLPRDVEERLAAQGRSGGVALAREREAVVYRFEAGSITINDAVTGRLFLEFLQGQRTAAALEAF